MSRVFRSFSRSARTATRIGSVCLPRAVHTLSRPALTGVGLAFALTATTGSFALCAPPKAAEKHAVDRTHAQRIHDILVKISGSDDIWQGASKIVALYRQKCDLGANMSLPQLMRFLAFHADQDLSPDDVEALSNCFDLDDSKIIHENEFLAVYTLLRTMEGKFKKTMSFKLARANFNGMDLDNSGQIDKEELSQWLELGIRCGYFDSHGETGKEFAAELLKIYDKDGNDSIDVNEFHALFKNLVAGGLSSLATLKTTGTLKTTKGK